MDLNRLAEGLEGSASFHAFLFEDNNPLRGQIKFRMIHAPNRAMRQLHNRLRAYLTTVRPELPFATGALPGCSPRKNVAQHRNNRYFFLTDIVSAYDSVDLGRLAKVLAGLDDDLDEEMARAFLERYCLLGKEGLITGAPASPDLYNIYAGILLDVALGEYCQRHGLTLTRYLDDVTISSSEENGPIGKHKRREIRSIIKRCGFEMNHSKTYVLDLQKGPITINGIGLELGGRMFLPRHYHHFLRGLMKRSLTDPEITYPMLAGRMGVFWGVTDKKGKLNKTELKLAQQFVLTREALRRQGRL